VFNVVSSCGLPGPIAEINVASICGLPGPVSATCSRFASVLSEESWIDVACVAGAAWRIAFPEQVVGRIAIRDHFRTCLEGLTGRSYTKRQINNLLRQYDVWGRATWPVRNVPALPCDTIESRARAAAAGSRQQGGGRKPSFRVRG
jgi:hypothetical protein